MDWMLMYFEICFCIIVGTSDISGLYVWPVCILPIAKVCRYHKFLNSYNKSHLFLLVANYKRK